MFARPPLRLPLGAGAPQCPFTCRCMSSLGRLPPPASRASSYLLPGDPARRRRLAFVRPFYVPASTTAARRRCCRPAGARVSSWIPPIRVSCAATLTSTAPRLFGDQEQQPPRRPTGDPLLLLPQKLETCSLHGCAFKYGFLPVNTGLSACDSAHPLRDRIFQFELSPEVRIVQRVFRKPQVCKYELSSRLSNERRRQIKRVRTNAIGCTKPGVGPEQECTCGGRCAQCARTVPGAALQGTAPALRWHPCFTGDQRAQSAAPHDPRARRRRAGRQTAAGQQRQSRRRQPARRRRLLHRRRL